jgi:hypothetical protein
MTVQPSASGSKPLCVLNLSRAFYARKRTVNLEQLSGTQPAWIKKHVPLGGTLSELGA